MENTQRPAGESPQLAAALAGLKRGWSVVPVMPRAKRPIIRWEVFQHRKASEEEARGWFRRWPDANLSLVTGALSGVVVLDVDPRHGGDDSLARLEAANGALPQTVESVTGGGGRHIYFAHPGRETRNRAGIEPGLDLRGDGGTIVLPPSIHPSGNPYRWRAGHAPGEVALALFPPWLVDHRQRG